MTRTLVRNGPPDGSAWNAYVAWDGGKYWLATNEAIAQASHDFGYDPIAVDATWMQTAGPVIGPNPDTADAWGVWVG